MKISILEPLGISSDDLERLSKPLIENGHNIVSFNEKNTDVNVLKERAKDADIIVIANMPLSGEVINSDKNLKMISVAFTGIDHVDADACKENGITICNAAGYSTYSVAELTFGLMIDVLRNVVPCDSAVRSGRTKAGLSQHELYGKTLGVIGTGAIGLKVCEIAKAFGLNVLAYSRSQKAEALKLGVKYVTLDELLKLSDIVSIHTPLNSETRDLIDSDKLSLMKESAILINTARGPIVNGNALAEALKSGKIAGAGIDVFETEPPISNADPLIDAPNTVLTPHIGFATDEAILKRAEIVFDNISSWISGNPKNVVKL